MEVDAADPAPAPQPEQQVAPEANGVEHAAGAEAPATVPDPLEAQWKAVHENPNDFAAWTALISAAEKLDDLDRLRQVYGPFLTAYPLCYGYWKKYADAEHRKGNTEAALQVYERGTAATPYSMDLWGHFASYKKTNGGTPDDVRNIYERAITYCGTDYLAHALWDKVIHHEEEQGVANAVAKAYCRVLGYPLRELPRYLQSLQSFMHGRSASEVMEADEMERIMGQLKAQKEAKAAEGGAAEGEAPDTSVSDDEIKAAWLAEREAIMGQARAVMEARKQYEEGIKRAYFHVKPLDHAQLANWVRYLDYMETHGPEALGATVIVYERCLVACASYPEYWERYIRFLEAKGMQAEAQSAADRAAGIFCKSRPEMHLFVAQFEERHGRVDAARARYAHVLRDLAPRLLQAVVAAANFERRQGDREAACRLYEDTLCVERAAEGEHGSKLYPFLAMQYASFLYKVYSDTPKARAVLAEALQTAPHIRQLWEAAIHLEETAGGDGMVGRVMELYAQATAEPPQQQQGVGLDGKPLGSKRALGEKEREELALRAVEFADQHGDAAALLAAQRAHAQQFMLPTSLAASAAAAAAAAGAAADATRKRAADAAAAAGGAAAGAADQAGAAKVLKTEVGASPAQAAAAAPMAAAATTAAPAAAGAAAAAADPAAAAAAAHHHAAAAAAAGYGHYPYPGYPPAGYAYPPYGYGGHYGHYGY